jgi:hypothetical protein
MRDVDNLRVLENAGVKLGGVFGLMVKPQAGSDFRFHDGWLIYRLECNDTATTNGNSAGGQIQ